MAKLRKRTGIAGRKFGSRHLHDESTGKFYAVGVNRGKREYVQLTIPVDSAAEQQRMVKSFDGVVLEGKDRRRLIASIPQRSTLADAIGEFYTPAMLQDYLAISPGALAKAAVSGRFIRLKTADGFLLFPAVQFDEHGQAPHGLSTLMSLLKQVYRNSDGWAATFWLTSPSTFGLGDDESNSAGSTRLDVLRAEGPERLIAQVRRMAASQGVTLTVPAPSRPRAARSNQQAS